MDSRTIEHRLNELSDRKSKNAFLESVINDPTAEILFELKGHKTVVFQGTKGPKSSTWEQTKQMAFELNANGIDVAFLPELLNETSADSLIKVGNVYKIADFKYCVTVKPNTLSKVLKHGFEQTNTIILKLTKMDSGSFKKTIDYLLRNEIPIGSIFLMNKFGETLELLKKEFKTGVYKKLVKGFL